MNQTRCSYNTPSEDTGKINMTVYRMTPFGVLNLDEKDSGDVSGDMEFVLAQRQNALNCRKNPMQSSCKELTNFAGDDPNSTDLVIEFKVRNSLTLFQMSIFVVFVFSCFN